MNTMTYLLLFRFLLYFLKELFKAINDIKNENSKLSFKFKNVIL